MIWPYLAEFLSTSITARKSLSLASASTQKTYSTFSGRSSRLTNGDRHVSASAKARKRKATQQQANTARQGRRDIGDSSGKKWFFGAFQGSGRSKGLQSM